MPAPAASSFATHSIPEGPAASIAEGQATEAKGPAEAATEKQSAEAEQPAASTAKKQAAEAEEAAASAAEGQAGSRGRGRVQQQHNREADSRGFFSSKSFLLIKVKL